MLESPRGRYIVLGLMLLAQTGASLISPGIGALAPFLLTTLGLSKIELGTLFTAMMIGYITKFAKRRKKMIVACFCARVSKMTHGPSIDHGIIHFRIFDDFI